MNRTIGISLRAASLAAAVFGVAALVISCTPEVRESNADGASTASAAAWIPSDAIYVGQDVCISCHEQAANHYSNTLHSETFRLNPRGAEQREVCEACHGPGSMHVEETWDKRLIIGYTRNWETPVAVQNGQCLTCHQGGGRMHWQGSVHDNNEVACSDCHNPMVEASLVGAMRQPNYSETCYGCHAEQRMDFMKRSHMPVPEGKMVCQDCHNPHGSTTEAMLNEDSLNEVCYNCHAEKRGPFLWEHAPVRENCANCHEPHGSNHESLLVTARPFLCQQCHNAPVGHPGGFYNNSQTAGSSDQLLIAGGLMTQSARVIGRGCQNCHSQIHGSNHPSGARWQR
jgi:DmsE family decaheme c-type cytochrome